MFGTSARATEMYTNVMDIATRTKQTAKKCCSGVAKPVKIAGCKRRRTSSGDTTLTSSSPLSSPPSSPIIAETTHPATQNRFCYLCHDGGNTVACSNRVCSRVVCNVCIKILQEIEDKLGSPGISFKCPACHEKDEREMRSKPMPYFAFTRMVEGKSVPACDKPTFIRGPILLLHFIYMGMNSRGSLPWVLNTVLEEYHTASTLHYHEVVFDFGTWDKLCHWETKAQALATEIGKDNFEHKVIFVSVHSEVTRGDLFVGKDEKGEDVAVEPLESIIFMLSCGPLVTFHDSISSFKKAIIQLQPAYTVAFGADRFISAVLKSFIIAFGVRVLIQGHALCEVITDLLDVSLELRMHSDTFFFQSKVQTTSGLPLPSSNPLSVIGIRYSWYHNHRHPWGTALPMSCPKCSSVRSWSRSKVGVDSTNTIVRISTCCSPECKYEFFSYPPVGPYEVIKENKSMGWIKRTAI
ncbi:hypothetical protein EDD15DRAFT_2203661 [Pisolithus albus]|nr:hypothetical protein EDD15DRAFT_2203661 [Pisolithus albus]